MKARKTVVMVLALSLSILFISACSYKKIQHGTEITQEQIGKIVDGQTTKEDVFVEFGDPSKIMHDEKVFFYTWTRGSKKSLLGIGGGSAFTESLVIIFDDHGVVKKHRLTRGTTKEGAIIGD